MAEKNTNAGIVSMRNVHDKKQQTIAVDEHSLHDGSIKCFTPRNGRIPNKILITVVERGFYFCFRNKCIWVSIESYHRQNGLTFNVFNSVSVFILKH